MFTNGTGLAPGSGLPLPRCCEPSSVSIPHGQRVYCLFQIPARPVFSEARGGSPQRLGSFGPSFQAGLPKVKRQHRCFTPPSLPSFPAKPSLTVSVLTVPSATTPHPSLTPYRPFAFAHGWVLLFVKGRGRLQTLSSQLARLHTSVRPGLSAWEPH